MPRPTRRSLRRPALLTALVVGASTLAAVPAAPVALGAPGCKVTNLRTGVSKASLQAAVTAARGGDMLEIRGTCVGTTDITKSLKLVGKRTTTLGKPVLDANLAGRVLTIAKGRTVRITGLTIRRGTATAESVPANRGGGIYNEGSLTLTKVTVRSNASEDRGGGIYTTGTLNLGSGTRVINNLALYGAGVFVDGETSAASLTMAGDATITKSSAASNGGGIYAWTAPVSLKGTSSVHTNVADNAGAAVFLTGATLDLFGSSSLHDNTATSGGAVEGYAEGSVLSRVRLHDSSSVYRNSAETYASAIGVEGTIRMEDDAVVRNNTVAGGTGAVELWTYVPELDSSLTMKDRSRIRNNTSGAAGGGIYIYDDCGGDIPTLSGATATRVTGNTPDQIVHHPACG